MSRAKRSLIQPNISWRKVKDEAVILNLETSEYFSANETGTFLWERLAAGDTPAEAAALLAGEFGVEKARAEADAAEFAARLAELGVISRAEEK